MANGTGQGTWLCFASTVDHGGGATVGNSAVGMPYEAEDFAIDPQYIYVGTNSTGTLADTIKRGPLDAGGSALTPLVSGLSGFAYHLRATQNGLYWIDSKSDICASSLDGSRPAGDSGCGGGLLAAGLPGDAAATNSDGFAVAQTSAYQSLYRSGAIRRVPLDGGAQSVLVQFDAGVVRLLAANDTDVVWSEALPKGTYVLRHVPSTGGPVTVLADAAVSAGFAMDSAWVYFAEAFDGGYLIVKVPIGGGTPQPSVRVPAIANQPSLIEVDDQNIYWAGALDQQVYAVQK